MDFVFKIKKEFFILRTIRRICGQKPSKRLPGQAQGLAVFGYALGALAKPLFAIAPTAGVGCLRPRLPDRASKGIRGAPRDGLVAAALALSHLRPASIARHRGSLPWPAAGGQPDAAVCQQLPLRVLGGRGSGAGGWRPARAGLTRTSAPSGLQACKSVALQVRAA
jgi:hypothetical protein